ncbi:YbgF trimerization domain-containing protein [Vogesella mureinivorans]|uniref:YbgF trimerization domain-containing protein n=1 Tax=Vogesella mureinivorans TaxID=657276 RepID=UPI0011CA7A31|nr:YbgF trimerization domain-containing protein [Vogesella mureinivorans]
MRNRLLPLLLPIVLGACATTTDLEQARLDLETKLASSSQQASARLSDVEAKLANQRLLDLVNQVTLLKGEMATLRGQNEVLQHQVAETQKRQNDLYNDIDLRLGKMEKQLREASQPQAEAPAAEAPAAEPAAANPADAALARALEVLRARDFAKSLPQLKAVVDGYPGSEQSLEAIYWMGVAHTALKQYSAAIDIQRRFAEQYPKHPKAPETLRLMAGNQLQLEQKDQARLTLRKIIKQYPGTPAAQRAQQQLATL